MSAIILMTWKEMMRKRVMLLSLLMTVVFLVAFWFVAKAISSDMRLDGGMIGYEVDQLISRFIAGAIILTLGFFFGSFVIAFLSIFSSVGVIAGEAEQGVLQSMLPRPIARWSWYLGRWIGFVSFGIAYGALLFGSILFIGSMHAALPGDWEALLKSFALFALVVPLLVSVSMLGSSFFSAIGNGVFMVMLFGAGWLGGMIEKVTALEMLHDDRLKALNTISGLFSMLMPVDSLQRRMLAEMFSLKELMGLVDINNTLGPFSFQQVPSNTFIVYSVCYTLAALLVGMYMFQRKDL